MTNVIKIKKGLNIPLSGEAEKKIVSIDVQDFAVKPTDFVDVFPKLYFKEGASVKAGTALFYDKNHPELQFTSPVSGVIEEVKRGAKRKILEIKIKSDGKNEAVEFPTKAISALTKDEIQETLLKSGAWVNIRQRPYKVIANPKDEPRDIFISTFDTAPLAPDTEFIFKDEMEAFQAGIDVLTKLTSGDVYLGIPDADSIFAKIKNAKIRIFKGLHPAGNVGIQIHHTKAVNKGEKIWVLQPQGVLVIGRLFLSGKYDVRKTIAVTGSEVDNPHYVQTFNGASLNEILSSFRLSPDTTVRYISGNVLTGERIEKNGYIGNFDQQITIVPEGNHYEFLGWAMPRFKKFSFSRSYFSWLFPKKQYAQDTNINGGERPFVVTGELEKVLPMDIYPMQLLKAIIVKDLDLMENLGIYEVDEEDFALCEFVDASKNNIQAIIRDGLDFVRNEME
jgi:Na+-transporting NADH:ubiquinone oxidoreductase subunit A